MSGGNSISHWYAAQWVVSPKQQLIMKSIWQFDVLRQEIPPYVEKQKIQKNSQQLWYAFTQLF